MQYSFNTLSLLSVNFLLFIFCLQSSASILLQVRISIKSDEDALCQRSFLSNIQPAPSNTISIKYRPAESVPDSLIFLTRTKPKRTQPSEYIAIEVKDRRIVAHWDVGGGEKTVTNTHPIYDIIAKDRYLWYQIDLERYAI